VFATPDLAARIDRAEGRLCAGIATTIGRRHPDYGSFSCELAAGVAVFAGQGSPTNKIIGLGFEGVPREADLEAIERRFAERGAPLQAEISTLAAPELHALLVRRGYEPRGFENVLGHALADLEAPDPSEITVDVVRDQDLPAWMEVVVSAFAHPDQGGLGGDAIPPLDELRRWLALTMSVPGFRGYLARIDGKLAGGGSIRLDSGIAQFCGAGTLPAFRRRGVQTALVRARLANAAESGCDVAVVTTQPASRSQQNVQREGFALLYARQLLVKMP
jgi:GNAT superfamily N-acetyltransferase